MFTDEEFVFAAKKYMDCIYRVAFSWLKNPHDANDVTQDVLLKLYNTDMSFESESHMKNWLIRVTINQCKSLYRSAWYKSEDISDYIESLSFEQSEYSDLFEAVMKLDKKYRVPLLLHYYEGYSTAEIAAMLKISQSTVCVRLFRAKTKLRDFLGEE